jgi:type III secretion protein J
VSYDVEGAAGRQQAAPSHISALIVYHNTDDEAALINQIKRFLKNSITTVNYDDISVVLTKKPDVISNIPQLEAPKQQFNSMYIIGAGVILVLISGGLILLVLRKSGQKQGAKSE